MKSHIKSVKDAFKASEKARWEARDARYKARDAEHELVEALVRDRAVHCLAPRRGAIHAMYGKMKDSEE